MNGIFIKGQVTTMLEEGKSQQEVVDFFYNAGMVGHVFWVTSSRDSIETAVN